MASIVAGVTETGPMLQIVEMRVPSVVEDGSATSVILDCDYVLRSADKKSELVVQWYFQNGSSPVYQWIPGKRPQDLGILKGRLNLDYRASNDPYKRHRALEILKPTYELSGVYRCKVATVEEEAVSARTMIVYSELGSCCCCHLPSFNISLKDRIKDDGSLFFSASSVDIIHQEGTI